MAGDWCRLGWLGVSYSVWFNRRHRRVGHLFQGRFAGVVLEDGAVAEVSRYVHLNPVRVRTLGLDKPAQARQRVGLGEAPQRTVTAERVRRLREYRWSSYRAAVGLAPAPGWLAVDVALELMGGRDRRERQQRYREYVEAALRDGLPASPWERLEGQVVLGGKEFVARMRQRLAGNEREQPGLRRLRERPTWAAVVQAVAAERGAAWVEFRDQYGDWGRDAALYLGRKRCGLKLRELGELVGGLDYRSVSWAVQQVVRRRVKDREFAERLGRLESKIQNPEM